MANIQVTIQKAPTIDRRKYRGLNLAIWNRRVIASGRTGLEALKKARKKYPRAKVENIELMSVPKEDVMILIQV